MNDKFVRSSIWITLFFGSLLFLYYIFINTVGGISIAVGVLFSLGNLFLLWKLIKETITEGERNKRNIAGLLILKFLILWGGIIILMALNLIDPLFFAVGFSIILIVFSLKGFGGWLYGYFFR